MAVTRHTRKGVTRSHTRHNAGRASHSRTRCHGGKK